MAGRSFAGDVIFQDNFRGPAFPVSLNGFAPDIRPEDEQWTAASSIRADGSCNTNSASAWLPISFQGDQVYTITLFTDVTYSSGSNTSAGGVALTTATTSFDTGRPANSEIRGFLEFGRSGRWVFYDVGNDAAITGAGNDSLFTSSQTDYEVKLVLTTSNTASWKLEAFLGGVQMDLAPADGASMSYEYPSKPTLTGAGLFIVSSTSKLKNFTLQGPVAAVAVEPTSRIIDVFLLAGQSNMSGRVSTGYTADARDSKCLYYYRADGPAASDVDSGGEFTTIHPLASGYYGPEISLARGLVDKGYRPAIIKVSDGGTSIESHWNPTTYGIWWKNWRSSVSHALAKLEAMGYVVRLRGFLWLQGETDADNQTRADTYEGTFTDLLAAVDADLTGWGYDSADMNVVCAVIHSASGTYAGTVRLAQQAVIDTTSDARWFDTDDLSVQNDNLHYDATAITTIGERFSAAFPPLPSVSD